MGKWIKSGMSPSFPGVVTNQSTIDLNRGTRHRRKEMSKVEIRIKI